MLTIWEWRWNQQKQGFHFQTHKWGTTGIIFYRCIFYTLSSVSSSVKLKVLKHVSFAPEILCINEWTFIVLFLYFGRWPLSLVDFNNVFCGNSFPVICHIWHFLRFLRLKRTQERERRFHLCKPVYVKQKNLNILIKVKLAEKSKLEHWSLSKKIHVIIFKRSVE